MQPGLLAEFDSPSACARAIRELRAQGSTQLETFMPYPAKEVQEALQIERSPLPLYVLIAGAVGAGLAYLILWGTNAYDYPLNVGSHPDNAVPAFLPISFETLVLFAGCAAFVGALLLGGMPRLYDPVDEVEEFRRVSVDRFIIVVQATNPGFHWLGTSSQLSELGALRIRELGNPAALAGTTGQP